MGDMGEIARAVAHLTAEAVAETLWPTRCALCDAPGLVLCERCAANLPHLDWWRACRRCGSPFGYVQCELCNPVGLARIGREELPFAGCASAMLFDDDTGRIVRVFKDQGEQRLAPVMAEWMVRVIPPQWAFEAVTFIPASLAAYRHRGFDHAELIGESVAKLLGASCLRTLARPKTHDQRTLGAHQRIANLKGRFEAVGQAGARRILLVDDVYTTGSTLCSATDALLEAGCEKVYCLTFARV